MNRNEIKLCPFRICTEVRPAAMVGHEDVTVTWFMECLKNDCPAWYEKEEFDPSGGIWITVEECKRLKK